MPYYVYMMASQKNGTLYVGVTNDLIRRIWEHKEGVGDSFTKEYSVENLVFFETHDEIANALQREKNIKHWNRDWKIALIEQDNPDWHDLYAEIAA